MPLRYRNHLIIEKATFDAQTGFWNVRAQIQYNEHIEFRDVLIAGPIGRFQNTKVSGKLYLREGKRVGK